MRRLISTLLGVLLLFIPANVPAQSYPVGRVMTTLVDNYDVITDGYTYVVFGDRSASATATPVTGVFGPGTAINKLIETTGSSTSVRARTATQGPFTGVVAGDLLIFPKVVSDAGVISEQERTVTDATDADNVVVDTAIDLDNSTANDGSGDGTTFRHKKIVSGTTAAAAWFSVEGFDDFNIQADVTTINATSLDFTVECRVSKFAAANTIYTKNFTAAGSGSIAVGKDVKYEECRIGWAFNTDTGVQNVATYFIGSK